MRNKISTVHILYIGFLIVTATVINAVADNKSAYSQAQRKTDIELMGLRKKWEVEAPYLNNHYRKKYTLYNLCSEPNIVVGQVKSINKKTTAKSRLHGEVTSEAFVGEKKVLNVTVIDSLKGSSKSNLSFIVNYRDVEEVYTSTKEWDNIKPGDILIFFFNEATVKKQNLQATHLVQWESIIAVIDDDQFIQLIRQYIKSFTDPWDDQDSFYDVLFKQSQSNYIRIREDANITLQYFFMFCSSATLQKVLSNNHIISEHKDYITKVVIPIRVERIKNLNPGDCFLKDKEPNED